MTTSPTLPPADLAARKAREIVGEWLGMFNPPPQIDFQQSELLLTGIAHELRTLTAASGAREGEAYREAVSLATTLWEKHWKDQSPNWKPLPDTSGVISQIDNMVAGLARPVAGTERLLETDEQIDRVFDDVVLGTGLIPAERALFRKGYRAGVSVLATQDAGTPAEGSKSDEQIVAEVNDLARVMLKCIGNTGYAVPDGYLFWKSDNPRARKAWQIASEAYELITATEVHDALLAVEEDEELVSRIEADNEEEATRKIIAELETELGVKGAANVFRASLDRLRASGDAR